MVERLRTPIGDDLEAIREELRLVAQSASRVEEVLRDAAGQATAPCMPTHFDISGAATGNQDGGDGPATMGDGGGGDGDGHATHAFASRWTRQAEHGPWKKSGSSKAALGEGASSSSSGSPGLGMHGAAAAVPLPANTNDLAEAERRAHLAAQQQLALSQQHQQQRKDEQQLQEEEQERQRRAQLQQDELQRHQAATQRAAEARAAEEAKQRQALIDSMSPEELARAAELHAQQAAVGMQTFGTQSAGQAAGLVFQQHVRGVARAAAEEGDQADVDLLMSMSPEQVAEWDRNRHNTEHGGVPW
jgi:hypothetical protein